MFTDGAMTEVYGLKALEKSIHWQKKNVFIFLVCAVFIHLNKLRSDNANAIAHEAKFSVIPFRMFYGQSFLNETLIDCLMINLVTSTNQFVAT